MSKTQNWKSVLFSQVTFFWLVLLIFMVVSVTESGDFFNKAITHGAFYGTLGYAVAAVFDLLSLVCMIARINASRIADRRGEWLSLLGVIVCAGVSAFANVASAVQDYNISQFAKTPWIMQDVSPYLGAVFPVMIVIVTLIADHIGDLNPQQADSVANYRAKEQKKVDLLRVRLEIERDMSEVKKQMALLHEKPSKKIEKIRQEYTKMLADMRAASEAKVNDLRAFYDTQINDLHTQVATLQSMIQAFENATQEVNTDEIATITQSVADSNDGVNISNTNTGQKSATNIVDWVNTKRGNASPLQRARRALKSHPEMRVADLAKRLQISSSYASQLRAKVLKEA